MTGDEALPSPARTASPTSSPTIRSAASPATSAAASPPPTPSTPRTSASPRPTRAPAGRYIYAGQNQLLAEYTNGQWTSYVWNGNDPVALVRANQIYYIHPDHLGRPEKVTNSGKAFDWKANNFGFNRGLVQRPGWRR